MIHAQQDRHRLLVGHVVEIEADGLAGHAGVDDGLDPERGRRFDDDVVAVAAQMQALGAGSGIDLNGRRERDLLVAADLREVGRDRLRLRVQVMLAQEVVAGVNPASLRKQRAGFGGVADQPGLRGGLDQLADALVAGEIQSNRVVRALRVQRSGAKELLLGRGQLMLIEQASPGEVGLLCREGFCFESFFRLRNRGWDCGCRSLWMGRNDA